MGEVQAPGVWATYHAADGSGSLRLRVLEVVDPAPYVIVADEHGVQTAMGTDTGWWSDPDGTLPALLPTAPR